LVAVDSAVAADSVAADSVAAVDAVRAATPAVIRPPLQPMEDERNTIMSRQFSTARFVRLLGLMILVASFASFTVPHAAAQQATQKTFDSPGKAADAMYDAAKAGDTKALMQIFGPDSKELLASGDPVADKDTREKVVKKYEEMHRLVTEPNKSVTLFIGAENWPFPIPIVEKNKVWFFDTEKGKKEVLLRRIGRNETFTIGTLQSLVDAQNEYMSTTHDQDSTKQYAQKILSDEGKHNGLYWKTAPGEPASPIGPLIAQATREGYEKGATASKAVPFHGYFYRILTRQGKDARGGAMSFMSADGKLTKGFAFIAYPAEYRNSGVMTFIVGKNGQVYQKDLGPNTEKIASTVTDFNPDKTWSVTE
jgi:hypothetical protein